MLFAWTYSVSIKRPLAPQSTSAFVCRFIFVSVVSISTSMSNEVVLSEEMMYLLGRRFSQRARRMRSHFGGLEGEEGSLVRLSHNRIRQRSHFQLYLLTGVHIDCVMTAGAYHSPTVTSKILLFRVFRLNFRVFHCGVL